MKALILSAGFGKRAKPLSDVRPKPLFPFRGRPIIEHIVENLKKIGVNEFLVNLHWKGVMIEEFLKKRFGDQKIVLKYEPEILGTGGAIKNFEDELKDEEVFLLHNGDTIDHFELGKMMDLMRKKDFLAVLSLKKAREKFRKVKLEKDGKVYFGEEGDYNYTGVSLWKSEIMRYLPDGKSSLALEIFLNKEFEGKIGGVVSSGVWYEFNTPEVYLKNSFNGVEKDYYMGEGCNVLSGIKLFNVILWDNVVVEGEGILENSILTDNTKFKLKGEVSSIIVSSGKIFNIYI